jgi:Mn-dependent DtxR family transcriptional regulator
MKRLHAKGYISNPIGKAKSVGMTEEGFLKAKELFERHFTKEK